MGGGGFMQDEASLLDVFLLGLARRQPPRACFVPTASGDSDAAIARFYRLFPLRRCQPSHLPLFGRPSPDLRSILLAQDVIYVGGGNTANLLAIWRLHGVDAIIREAWEAGVVLGGVSAGALCWFESGVTDSFGVELAPLTNGLGLLAGSFCPHYDSEVRRRPLYERLIADGTLPDGYAAEDGAALHYVGTRLDAVVTSRPSARAFRLTREADGASETPMETRYLGA